jgi:hypothetical protein
VVQASRLHAAAGTTAPQTALTEPPFEANGRGRRLQGARPGRRVKVGRRESAEAVERLGPRTYNHGIPQPNEVTSRVMREKGKGEKRKKQTDFILASLCSENCPFPFSLFLHVDSNA